MTRRRLEALLLSAVLTITTCLPMGTMSAYAAESAPADSTEVAAVQEEESLDSDAESIVEDSNKAQADDAVQAESTDEQSETTADENQEKKPITDDQPEETEEEEAAAPELYTDEESEPSEPELPETGTTIDAAVEEETAETAAVATTETAAVIDEKDVGEIEVEVTSDYTNELSLDDSTSAEELLNAYIEQEMGLTSDSETAKYRKKEAGKSLKGLNKLMYDTIAGKLESIAAGTVTSTVFTIPLSKGDRWFADDLGVSNVLDYNSKTGQYTINDEAYDTFYNPNKVIFALITDYPYELYWFNKTCDNLMIDVPDDIRISGMISTDDRQYFEIKEVTKSDVSLAVLKEYAASGETYTVDPATGEAVRKAVANADSILAKYSSNSDYDKLKGYCTDICSLVSYDEKAQSNSDYAYSDGNYYGNPWQLVYVFDGDTSTNVVCEGYAKAFQYLCDKTTFNNDDICCMTVSGGIGGESSGHMWNIVTMDDGLNYLVDVTNCDAGAVGEPYELFMAGTAGSVSSGYRFYIDAYNSEAYAYNPEKTSIFKNSELALADHYYGKKSITNIGVTFDDYVYYDGTVKKPEVNVTSKETGKELVKGTDYDVYYYEPNPSIAGLEEQNVAPGESAGALQIIGKGDYYGRALVNFDIICDLSLDLCTASVPARVAYTGGQRKPAVTVKFNGVTLECGKDYTISFKNNINAGTATVTVTGVRGRVTGAFAMNFTIVKAAQNLSLAKMSVPISQGQTITITPGEKYQFRVYGSKGKVTATSSNTSCAKASASGKVITVNPQNYGTTKITIKSAATANYKAATTNVTIKVMPAATTSLKAYNLDRGFKLQWAQVDDVDGYVIYRTVYSTDGTSTTKKIKTIGKASTVTYTDKVPNTNGRLIAYTVKAKSGNVISTLSKTVTTYRLTKGKIGYCKKSSATQISLNWRANAAADGYEVQYSRASNFKSGTKTVKYAAGTTKATLTGLTSGKTYYVRVRSYKMYGKTKCVSAWSAMRTLK